MKKFLTSFVVILVMNATMQAQVEPAAGTWKPWFISSGKEHRLVAPSSYKTEIAEILEKQKKLTANDMQQIHYWNAGAPGYRWHEMMNKIWTVDTGAHAILANLLLGTAIYDATIVAWDTKYAHKRPRPFEADKRIKAKMPNPESPSYPCEYSVAAGAASTIFAHFYPHLADSVKKLAEQAMSSRVAAGLVFPSDTKAGFELGKRIAAYEIELTKDYVTKERWDGKVPDKPGLWRGKFAMFPMAGKNRTVVLKNGSQYRPGPPPDFAGEMTEMKNYKQTFRSLSNAFYWANNSWFMDMLPKKMFETNLHLNPPRAARLSAALGVASYDGFIACWDAKYAYWGIRPNQYDTTFKPAILVTPPFPGYPSGHAAISATMSEILGYFFPEEKDLYKQKAKEAAESRFQAGIHFRSDNEVAVELGKKVAADVIKRVRMDGADE